MSPRVMGGTVQQLVERLTYHRVIGMCVYVHAVHGCVYIRCMSFILLYRETAAAFVRI